VQRFAQAVFHLALVALRFHVDEIDHDQAAQVAQAQLARDFLGCFEVGAERRLLDVAAAVERAELTSIATSASVWSMTTAPPAGRFTWRE